MTEETRWLDADQQRAWRGLVIGMTLLTDRLDADLRRGFDISLAEYEILVRLSESDGVLRMAQLASSMGHSRSRVTHTIARMEKAGLVERRTSRVDGRGVDAVLTDKGMDQLCSAAPLHRYDADRTAGGSLDSRGPPGTRIASEVGRDPPPSLKGGIT